MSNTKLRTHIASIQARLNDLYHFRLTDPITLEEIQALIDETKILLEANERLQNERRRIAVRIEHAQECSFK